MRTSSVLSAALLASSAVAAPLSLTSLFSSLTNEVDSVLASLGITLQTNATAAGPVVPYQNQCPGPVGTTKAGSQRYSPSINWPLGVSGSKFIDWKTYKANGANLGGWLEKEQVHDPIWWNQYAPNAADEWTFCQTLGSRCGPVLEARYARSVMSNTA